MHDLGIGTQPTAWPQPRSEVRDWTPLGRYRNLSDRTPTRIAVKIPPLISGLSYDPAGPLARAHESAVIAVARLEAGFGQHLAPLAQFLSRVEARPSSQTEQVDAGWSAFGDALAGGKGGEQARSQLAGVRALLTLIETAAHGPITSTALLEAHRALMAPDPRADHPGALRVAQSWIGGHGSSPIDAVYVPPPPDAVPDLIDDLLTFANRRDLPILAQAAIAHSQFVSIHPFADGNGRIGRALIAAILRRRGLTRRITVPLAGAMLADAVEYGAQVENYRRGDVDAFVGYFSRSVLHACEAAEQSAARLAGLHPRWRAIVRPPAKSADEILIDNLLETPIFNADTAIQITGADAATTSHALDRLTDAGILEVVCNEPSNRVWAARDVLTELDNLPLMTGIDAAPAAPWQLESPMLLSSCRFRL
ncbi:MAG: Fic family protein [Mycobacteriaceae bacterium]|nr:Fic family protein [Mycobacteriaceae bacterium]